MRKAKELDQIPHGVSQKGRMLERVHLELERTFDRLEAEMKAWWDKENQKDKPLP